VLDAPLPPPLVIVGVPRTGTTALHKLLSMDDRYQVLENWIVGHPMVRPPRSTWETLPAYQEAWANFELLPEIIRRTHLVEPPEADECLFLMAQSFVSNAFGSMADIADYDEWFLQEDMVRSFERLAQNLRLIGGDEPTKPFLLQNPSHVLALDGFLSVFPAARIVQTHRHPIEAIGSVVSLLHTVSGQPDPRRRAARELRVWGEGARRADAARAGREDQFFDVDYRALVQDPMGVIGSLYRYFGLELGDETASRMRRWLAENPQHKSGRHDYDPRALGVTPEAVEEHFGPYIARHGL
jgi:hypothetical protein